MNERQCERGCVLIGREYEREREGGRERESERECVREEMRELLLKN